MEANKVLNKQIFKEVLLAFIFLGIVLAGGYAIYSTVKRNNVLKDGDLILDVIDKDVANNLYIMGDSAGLSTKPYIANVTNNSKNEVTYNLIIKNNIAPNSKIEKYLRVAIDDKQVKYLNELEIDKNGNYIVLKESLDKGYTSSHTIRVWLSSESPNNLSGISALLNFDVFGN